MAFTAPVNDQLLAMRANAGIAELARAQAFSSATDDAVAAVAEGIARFAEREWSPLDRPGDIEGARLADGKVTLPAGFADAYRAYVEQGWNAIAAPPAHGGQGLPFTLACCVLESLGAANMAFTLLPMLTVGAIEALRHHGSDAQKALYLPNLVSGKWAGTMNLTEPQAGSDVGALRTAATPIAQGEHAGKYAIRGTKIFITWGEHDLAENIIHLVLARTPGSPAGSRGISLFLVPRHHVRPDGSPGERNDLRAVSIERKLGIHASPTCVMSYGDDDCCIGELVGAENGGLKAMFTMMNFARVNVGSQGVQVAEAAMQKAIAYARERTQSPRAGSPDRQPAPIIEHPDVRRMALRMRALVEAGRALLYYTAGQVDRAALGQPGAQDRADILVPLLKAWGTDMGCEVASLAMQIHGGVGYIEETGVAQHFRDSRIAPIYEGTNGIQAADLVTRKLGYGGGESLLALLRDVLADAGEAPALARLARDCIDVAEWMLGRKGGAVTLDDRLAGSTPFCAMCAVAVAGWQLMRQIPALSASGEERRATAKRAVFAFCRDHIIPEASGLKSAAMAGSALLYGLTADDFAQGA